MYSEDWVKLFIDLFSCSQIYTKIMCNVLNSSKYFMISVHKVSDDGEGEGGGGEMGLPRKIVSSDSQNGTRENLSILKIIENTWPIKYWKHHMLFSQFSVTSSYNSRNIIYKNKLILFCKSFNVTMSALFCFKRKKRCNLSGKVN